MNSNLLSKLKTSTILILILTVITGFIYPLMITGISRVIFKSQSEGAMITFKDKIIGSALIGQNFTQPKFFWGRPSSTQPLPYNPLDSRSSNLSPDNPALIRLVNVRIKEYKNQPHNDNERIPSDLITASASGLDPEISISSALYQVPRIAKARGLDPSQVEELIALHVKKPSFNLLGPYRVNVLELNLALEGYYD